MHSSTLTGTQIPDQSDVPDVPTHLSGIVNSLESYGVPRFATVAQRAAQWPNPPAGAMSYTADVNRLWVFSGGAWVYLLPDLQFALGQPRVTYSAWGMVGYTHAIVPDPAGTNILYFADQMVWHTVIGYGVGPVTVPTVAGRQVRIDAQVRFDGGEFPTDGTAELRIIKTAPTSEELVHQIVNVPGLSWAGGGASNVVSAFAFDRPDVGTATYEMQVRKRVPGDTTSYLRVRQPAQIGVFDVGPVSQIS